MPFSHFDRSAAEWIVLIRNRDPSACNDLHRLCLHVCIRHCKGWAEIDPEDATMEALLKIIQDVDRPEFRIRSSFEGYVYQTANRHCIDIKRRIRKERELLITSPPDALPQPPSPSEAGMSDPRRAALYDALRACIDLLPPDDQQLIGWSGSEMGPRAIAEMLGPPATANNVGVRLHRLRKTIKRCMGDHGQLSGRGL